MKFPIFKHRGSESRVAGPASEARSSLPASAAPIRRGRPRSLHRFLAWTLLLVSAAFCLSFAIWTWLDLLQNQPLHPYEMSGKWIRAPGEDAYAGYFIYRTRLPSNVRNAWMAISACDSFSVTVNGRPIGWYEMYRPTRPFQDMMSQAGQRLDWPLSSISLNFPREYQWEEHRSYLLPLFLDLTRYFDPGMNTICVEIESRRAPAKVAVDGGIELWTGEKISLASGPDWRAEPVIPDHQHPDWRSLNYEMSSWRNAVVTDPPPGQLYSSFDPRIFSTAFRGNWIRHPAANAENALWFQTEWQCKSRPDEAWMRIVLNRGYEIFINGQRGFVNAPDSTNLESGDWLFSKDRAIDPLVLPEYLYPNEVGSLFARYSFESPLLESAMDFDYETYAPISAQELKNQKLNEPASRLNMEKRGGFIQPVAPKALSRDLGEGAFVAYNLSGLLHEGRNTIAIRLARPDYSGPANWPGQIAVDGEASYKDGSREVMASDQTWTCWTQSPNARVQNAVSAQPLRLATMPQQPLCALTYRGDPFFRELFPPWVRPVFLATLFTLLGATLMASMGFLFRLAKGRNDKINAGLKIRPMAGMSLVLWDAILTFTVALGSIILMYVVFGERSEQLWFMFPEVWQWGMAFSIALAIVAALVRFVRLTKFADLRAMTSGFRRLIHELPNTRLWIFIIIWISMFSLFIRVYNLDFQALDYDEYPSAQAILSVAHEGIPSYVPEAVWYTRSPLYHYLTGGMVWLFGENLWAMCVPAALFGVATGVLFYLCGSRLLGRPWVGLAAMIMSTLNPHELYSSHMVRFYQQQQFFALLMAYCFCKGFVTDQSQRYRYLTLFVFLAATLSQEITAVAAIPLAIGYLLFAEKKPLHDIIKLLIVTFCVIAVILVDFIIYETHCLTRLEGLSPSMQADFQPHFWKPYNLLSLFLGYSRMHVFMSVMFFLGLYPALRERNRVSLALHFLFFSGIVLTNLLVTQVSMRYQYWLYPLLFLLAIDNGRAAFAWLTSLGRGLAAHRSKSRLNAAYAHNPRVVAVFRKKLGFAPSLCMTLLFTGVLISWSPWRLPSTYTTIMLGDCTGSFQYIRSQFRPGDVVMTTQPQGKSAWLEIGKCDYEMHIPVIYDFVLKENGNLVDRGSGAKAVTSLEQLQDICAKHSRLWVAIDREKIRTYGEKIMWQYPAARVELFLRKNFQLKYSTHLWDVYLWDANDGRYLSFRRDANIGISQ
jgi:Dolichyl-phosphate-mannose-protein mannosyltransferase